jgi:hypothetical protein
MKTVTFKEKIVKVDEKGQEKEYQEFFKRPGKDGEVHKPGESALVTDKAAIWLQANGFIEPLKKESKAKRETKELK